MLAVLYRNCVASSIQRMSRKNGEKQPRRLKTIQWRNGAVQKNAAFGKGRGADRAKFRQRKEKRFLKKDVNIDKRDHFQ